MRKFKIMVMDDDALSLELMEAMLVPNGYEVITTSDSLNAVELSIVKILILYC